MSGRLRIEIAGAGIAGLTAAAALAQRGHSVRVHESSGELREIGAGIYLKRNSVEVLKKLGLFDALTRRAERLLCGEIRDERNRVLLRRVTAAEEAFTVLRQTLHELLAEAARAAGAEIVTSSKLIAATGDGEITLAGGGRAKADLVIGAEGVNSVVRDALGLTRSNEKLPDGAIRLLIPRTNADQPGLSVENWSGPCRLGMVPCSPADIYMFLIGPQAERRAGAVPVDKAYWTQLYPHLADIIARIPPDVGRFGRHAYVTVSAWSRGRAAILGDAVHAQPPNLGQGAGMSMANAAALAETLDAHAGNVEAGLAAWEATRRPVSEAVQRWSYRYGVLGYQCPAPLYGARAAAIKALGRIGPTGRHWGWLWRGGMGPASAVS